jgi:hypothetical protein
MQLPVTTHRNRLDLGRAPDGNTEHDLTRHDLLTDNDDLMAHAGRILATKPSRRLSATATVDRDKCGSRSTLAPSSAWTSTSTGGRRVICGVGRDDRAHALRPAPTAEVRLVGFDGDQLAAGRLLRVG